MKMMLLWDRFRSKAKSGTANAGTEDAFNSAGKLPLYPQLSDNLQHIGMLLGHSPDITIRRFEVGSSRSQVAVVYVNGISDMDMVNEFILHSLMIDAAKETMNGMASEKSMFDFIRTNALTVGEVKVVKDWNGVILSILSGESAIFIDGSTESLVCGTKGGEMRKVDEPSSQVVIRGPKDGFTESIATNVSLVRRRIKSSSLWLEAMKIGNVTQTDVAIMFIKGVAQDNIVQEIKKRLNGIDYDSILESGYIEELIQDKTKTIFPTIYNTERPDAVAGHLLDGRIAIFVDGTPFVLTAPMTFFGFFQATEDYYQRYEVATAIRLLRFASLLISLFVPAVFVSAITFHQEMIPSSLFISLAAQRESVPFPALIEATMMEVTFEILREAGIRLPRAVGQAVSIVGALVLGEAVVEAGIVSPAMIIVVAITGISSLATPQYSMASSIRLLRFAMIFAAGFLGFYGIVILTIIVLAHLCGLTSFGIPYMTPLAPFIPKDLKDTLFRLQIKSFSSRPRLISQNSSIMRVDEVSTPSPRQEQHERGSE